MSVHVYVAREWLERGAMPYRDSFDHKGPGLYALHALVLLLFGAAPWAFRLLELAWVTGLGVVCAWVVAPRHRRPEPGVVGISVLAANVFAFGFLDYWNTAQGELACALLTTASVLVARRARSAISAAIVGGLLCGAAVLVKPTALPFALVSLALIFARARYEGHRAAALGGFVGSFLFLPLLVTGYFALRGALRAAIDVLVFANAFYVTHEHVAHGLRGGVHACALVARHFGPSAFAVTALPLLGMVLAAVRRRKVDLANDVLAFALLLCGFASVVVQWKFFLYHWSIAAGGIVLAIASFTRHARRVLGVLRLEAVAATRTPSSTLRRTRRSNIRARRCASSRPRRHPRAWSIAITTPPRIRCNGRRRARPPTRCVHSATDSVDAAATGRRTPGRVHSCPTAPTWRRDAHRRRRTSSCGGTSKAYRP